MSVSAGKTQINTSLDAIIFLPCEKISITSEIENGLLENPLATLKPETDSLAFVFFNELLGEEHKISIASALLNKIKKITYNLIVNPLKTERNL